MSTKKYPIAIDTHFLRGVLRRIQKLGDAGHLPARTRKRLMAMVGNTDTLFDSELRRGKRSFTLVIRPSYELKRILGRLEARAEKAAA